MNVTRIKADGFRNLKAVDIAPNKEYNLITGLNAQGKTNLLEAVYLMTGCRSFRGSRDRDYIDLQRDKMEIILNFEDFRREQRIEYLMSRSSIKDKRIKLNSVPVKGPSAIFDSFKCVVFTPDDIDLVKGTPERRRSFIDMCVCQIYPKDIKNVRKYDIIIENRNNLLKLISGRKAKPEEIYVWNRQASVIGTIISQKRKKYVEKLNDVCCEIYKRISGGREMLEIKYHSNIFGYDLPDNDKAVVGYFQKLYDTIGDDTRLGYTTCGAHRDDLVITINGMNIREYGSQGQKKTAALAIKLGQAEIYTNMQRESPVILLDDVMGELDEERQKRVFETVRDMQVFITACNENAVKGLSTGAVFHVENGIVSF